MRMPSIRSEVAVAHNPRVLGVGIDEDTAVIMEKGRMRVVGAGAVYVVDGASISHSNIAEAEPSNSLSLHGVTLHVLSHGDELDIRRRRPVPGG